MQTEAPIFNPSQRINRMSNKISKEAASAQIDNWLDYYGLDFNDIVKEEGKEAAETLMNTLTRAIMRGELEIVTEGEFQITHNLKFPIVKNKESGDTIEQIIFKDKVGKARIAMGDSRNIHLQMYNFMGALSGIPGNMFSQLKGADSTVFTRISMVFSMV
jgi:hypothetical protein